MSGRSRLGIDFGTSHTVAVLTRGDGSAVPLLFDGSPLLPSAVYADPDGPLITGADALRAARVDPGRCEPHPKRRVDDGSVLLNDREVDTVDLFAAVLKRVFAECLRVLAAVPDDVTLTHPATWGTPRRTLLITAALRAGFPDCSVVSEPVAAARYLVEVAGHRVEGGAMIVADFGGGTFDASLVRPGERGFDVVSVVGRGDLGGVDFDEALASHVRDQSNDLGEWDRLARPTTARDRRHRHTWYDEIRTAKEQLSRRSRVDLHVPHIDRDTHLTQTELEHVVGPLIQPAADLVVDLAVGVDDLHGVFLVGGGSRMALIATVLHRALEARGVTVPPTVLEHPELIVAQGASVPLRAPDPITPQVPVAPVVTTPPAPSPPVAARPPGLADGAGDHLPGRRSWIGSVAMVLVVIAVVAVIVYLPSWDGRADDSPRTGDEATAVEPEGIHLIEHNAQVTDIAIGVEIPLGPAVVSADGDGMIQLYSEGDNAYNYPGYAGHEAAVTALSVGSLAGAPMVVSGDRAGIIKVWEPTLGTSMDEFTEHRGQIVDLVTFGDGTVVSVDTDSGVPLAWDLHGSDSRRELDGLPNGASSLSAVSGNDGSVVAALDSAGHDVMVFDAATGEQLYHLASQSRILTVDVATMGGNTVLAVAPENEPPYVWDPASDETVVELDDFGAAVEVLSLYGWNGRLALAAGGDGGLVRVWDAHSAALIAEFDAQETEPDPLPAMAFLETTTGLHLYVATLDRVIEYPIEM